MEEQIKNEADRLVELFRPLAEMRDCYHDIPLHENNDVKCAIKCVEEIDHIFLNKTPPDDPYANLFQLEFWSAVKKNLEDRL